MKLTNLFNRFTGIALLLVLGFILAFSPAGQRRSHELSHPELAAAITSDTPFVSVEDVAGWLIDKRPDVLVVDIRSAEDYREYHLPGAVNLPLASLFEPGSLDQLPPETTPVLYSNGSVYAAQAWVMLQQLGINSYVMSGGLNHWAKAILNPEKPGDLASNPELLQYNFRKSASGFFNGGLQVEQEGQTVKKEDKPAIIRRPRRKKAEEGC